MELQFVACHPRLSLDQPTTDKYSPVPLELVDGDGGGIPLPAGAVVELRRTGHKHVQTVRGRVEVRDGRYVIIPQLWNREELDAPPLDVAEWIGADARVIVVPTPAAETVRSSPVTGRITPDKCDQTVSAVGGIIDQIA